jgi:molecular chaperone DnaJ
MSNYYEILGVSAESNAQEIKKAFRKLAQRYHPDKNQGDENASSMFKQINEAYQTLIDDTKRREYDLSLSGGGFSHFGRVEDIFSQMGFSDFFGGFAPRGERKFTKKRRDEPSSVRFEIPIHDLRSGNIKKSFSIKYHSDCSSCSGRGGSSFRTCTHCSGTGAVDQIHRFGPSVVKTSSPCDSCDGYGRLCEKVCSSCGGVGFKVVKEKFNLDIKVS